MANTNHGVGAQAARAQSQQWFLSESNWDEAAVKERRRELPTQVPNTAPNAEGVLVTDETGGVKDGTHTAHVGRQYLGSMGKIDNGVVSVSSLWAEECVYHPLDVIPYTAAAWFASGRSDPAFSTKLTIAVDLVKQAVARHWPFNAVVADSFYGEDATVRESLQQLGVGYVLALKPSHSGWHAVSELCSLDDVARATPWQAAAPVSWQLVDRGAGMGSTCISRRNRSQQNTVRCDGKSWAIGTSFRSTRQRRPRAWLTPARQKSTPT